MSAFHRSIRLPDYKYTQPGAYFVTLVTQGRADRFGKISAGEIVLTPAGEMLRDVWFALPDRFPQIKLDEFIVMPNHFHGIVIITDFDHVGEIRAGTRPAPTETSGPVGAPLVGARNLKAETAPTLGQIIGAYKSMTTHEYILGINCQKWPSFVRRLWQRNYYEHILRSDAELDHARAYIRENPLGWDLDQENPASQARTTR